MAKKICQNCEFYHPAKETKTAKPKKSDKSSTTIFGRGQCRFNPPGMGTIKYPATEANSWCGKFSPK